MIFMTSLDDILDERLDKSIHTNQICFQKIIIHSQRKKERQINYSFFATTTIK